MLEHAERAMLYRQPVRTDDLIWLANNNPDRIRFLLNEKINTLRDLGPHTAVVLFSGAGYSGLLYKRIAEMILENVVDYRSQTDEATGLQIPTGQPGIKGVPQSQLAFFGVSAGVFPAFLMSACNTPDKYALLKQLGNIDRFSLTTSPIGIGGDLSPYASMLDDTLLNTMQYDPNSPYVPPVFSLLTHAETGDTHVMWSYKPNGDETPGKVAAASSSALPLLLSNPFYINGQQYTDGASLKYGLNGIDIAKALFPEATLITIDALGTDINNSLLAHVICTLHARNSTTQPHLEISGPPARNSIDYALRILPFLERQYSVEEIEQIINTINNIAPIMNARISGQ